MFQPTFDTKGYNGFNPYYLGFEMFRDIRRICEDPTAEDKEWFPDFAGGNWREVCLDAVENLFNGKHYANTTQGESFKSYLIFLDSRKDGEELVPVILNQIDIVRSNINLLDSDFGVSIDTNTETAYTTYDEIQRLVPILKVDMMQAFNIAGDYVDNDGD